MKRIAMQIKFEGQTHQIDANTLISALVSYQAIITEANKVLGGGAKSIDLRVNALEKGSFIVDVSLAENLLKQIFSGDTMEYLANLGAVVGGVYASYKVLKGKPAKTENDKKAIEIKYPDEKVSVTLNDCIVKVYNQPMMREAVSKAIEAADTDVNVDGLSIDSGSCTPPVTFKKEEFKEYIYDGFEEEKSIPDEQVEVVDAYLTIIALNFEPGSRWMFMYNGFKIQMIVKDDALMKKINEGERFGKGDAIRVKMRIVKRYNAVYKAYENKAYKIVEFIEHIEAPSQGHIF